MLALKEILKAQKNFIMPGYEKTLAELVNEISEYNGEYSSEKLKEWLMQLLELKIDIQNDHTFDEETLQEINKIEVAKRVIKLNIYSSTIKLLNEYDASLICFGMGYNEKNSIYTVGHDKFTEEKQGKSDRFSVLKIETPSERNENKKTIITFGPSTTISEEIRYKQVDQMIEDLYKESKKDYKKTPHGIEFHYLRNLSERIRVLCECINRLNKLPEETEQINKYIADLCTEFERRYGHFEYPIQLPNKIIGQTRVTTNGKTMETYTIKESPVVTYQKQIFHY